MSSPTAAAPASNAADLNPRRATERFGAQALDEPTNCRTLYRVTGYPFMANPGPDGS